MSESSYPEAAYQWNKSRSLNKAFYEALSQTDSKRKLANSFVIPIRSGQAWEVKQGQVCRIIAREGPQVGDFNVWNKHNPRERMWASRTRQIERAHLSTYDRIWSNLPFLRPLLTITGDSLENYGVDADGGRVHDLLGTRCDPYVNEMLTGKSFDFNCHSNLVRAILPYGLTEYDVHDVLNVFQCTGLNPEDKYFMKTCPAKKGDYLEFFAEIDLLCALSTCPSGDQSKPLWGPGSDDRELVKICRPLTVELFDIDESLIKEWNWESPQVASYNQVHGLRFPSWSSKSNN